jgi:hypothetical protein
VIVAAAWLLMSGAPPFTADQCRVLKQVGVDTSDICPQSKKKSRVKR